MAPATEETRLLHASRGDRRRASTTSIWKRTSPATSPRFGKTKRIISYHNFRNTPDNLRELHDRLERRSMPTSSKSPRWPTSRTTTCACWR